MRTDSHSLSQGVRNAIHSRVEKCPSLVSTEAGLLRAAALNLGLGAVPQTLSTLQSGPQAYQNDEEWISARVELLSENISWYIT